MGEWGTGFGWVVINGERYSHDIIVLPDGEVLRRRKELSKNLRRVYGHTPFTLREFEDVVCRCGCRLEALVIGSGQFGDLPVLKEVYDAASRLGIKLIVMKTPEALSELKRLLSEGRCVAGVIHVTC